MKGNKLKAIMDINGITAVDMLEKIKIPQSTFAGYVCKGGSGIRIPALDDAIIIVKALRKHFGLSVSVLELFPNILLTEDQRKRLERMGL